MPDPYAPGYSMSILHNTTPKGEVRRTMSRQLHQPRYLDEIVSSTTARLHRRE